MLSIKDFNRPHEEELNIYQQILIGGSYTAESAYPMVVYYEAFSTHIRADFIAFRYGLSYDDDASCDRHYCSVKPYVGSLLPDDLVLQNGIRNCIYEVHYFITAYLDSTRRSHVNGDATVDCTRWCIELDGEERISTYADFSGTI